MNKKLGYWRIEQMLDQMGRGLNGALTYVGATKIYYKCRDDDSKPAPSTVNKYGLIDYEIGIQFSPNIGKRATWRMVVTLESNDTYIFRLLRPVRSNGKFFEVEVEYTDVHADMLKAMIEDVYDMVINERQKGYIYV